MYEELADLISLDGLSFKPSAYLVEEVEILQPRLAALGFTDISWLDGERDSFGPLTRVCFATDSKGNERKFIYG